MEGLGIESQGTRRPTTPPAGGGRPVRSPINAVATGRPSGQAKPGTSGRKKKNVYANAVSLDEPVAGAAPTGRRGGVGNEDKDPGGLGNFFKASAMKALEVADVPRSYAMSGIKEASDLIDEKLGKYSDGIDQAFGFAADTEEQKANREDNDASWGEFKSQAKRHIGGQELLDEAGMAGGWQRSALGFGFDVAADPTTWLIGPQTTALRGGSKLMTAAVRDGSAKTISGTIAKEAARLGLQADAGVQRLTVEAASRGRGALTPKALVEYGVSPKTATTLGLGKMTKTIGKDGPRIPGSGFVANAVEGGKGGLKNAARKGAPAKWARGKFVPEVLANRVINQLVFDRTLSISDRATAVAARTTTGAPLDESRMWASMNEELLDRSVGKKMHGLDDSEAVRIGAAWEAGDLDDVADMIRPEMARMRQEMVDLGVEVGDLGPNYMPHQVSDDFYKMAKSDVEVAQIVGKLDDKVGMQNQRLLNEGEELFGIKTNGLVSGPPTAAGRSLNDISMEVKKVKMFNDDPRVILPKYVKQSGEAIARARQMKMMEDLGISRELSERTVSRAIQKTPAEVAALKAARKLQRTAEADEIIALSDGSTLRRGALKGARDAVVAARKVNYAARKAATDKVQDLGRKLANAIDQADTATARLRALETSKARWERIASSGRKEAQNRARTELGNVNRRIVQARNEASQAKRLIDKIDSPAAKNSLKAWNDEIARLDMEQESLVARGTELSEQRTPLGEGDLLGDEMVRHLNMQLEEQMIKTNNVLDVADLAGQSFGIAAADANKVIKILDTADNDLAEAWKAATNAPATKSSKRAAQLAENTDLRARMDVIRQVLATSDNPVAQTLAKIEAAAIAADARAMRAGVAAVTFEQMVKNMDSPKFLTETFKDVVDTGMVKLGEAHQIPGWLNDAMKTQGVLRDVPGAKNFIGKAYNLWKGVAILRPGFQVRNAYSATFNLFLDRGAGAIGSMKPMRHFLSMMDDATKSGASAANKDYLARATQRWGATKANQMNEAVLSMYGSGTGQAAGEFATTGMRRGGLLQNINPLSRDNILLRKNQDAGEWVEKLIRSTHAYDVLRSGGDMDMARSAVNKWHFNYTDLNNFDQYAKLVIPFWTFFSRNMALQVQTFTQVPTKLNRSYVNAQRNLSYGQPEDVDTPDYYDEAGAIRLPQGFPGSGGENNSVSYLFPDLPAMQAPGLFDQMTNLDPRMLGNLGPIPQIAAQNVAQKQMFSGIPFKGQVEANIGSRGLNALTGGRLLQDHAKTGRPMISDEQQNIIGTLLPILSAVDRVASPTSESGKEKQLLSAVSWATGVGIRENNDRTRKGEQYRVLLEEQDAERYKEQMGL